MNSGEFMPITLKITEKQVFFVTRILLAGFYFFYFLGLIIGLFTRNPGLPDGTNRAYNLEFVDFITSGWSILHLISLLSLIAIIVLIILSKEPKDFLKNRMMYAFGAYMTLAGLTIFALGCSSTNLLDFRFEIASITMIIFGIILWFCPIIENAGRLTPEKHSLLKGIGSLLYFFGLTVSSFSSVDIIDQTRFSSLTYLYEVTFKNHSVRAFYPTFPDWIFGGLIWLILGLYWCFDYIEKKNVVKHTRSTKSILLTTVVVLFKLELLIFTLFFINFGAMVGASIKTMLVGNILGILAVIGITIILLMRWGYILDASAAPKPKPMQPSTLETEDV